MTDRTTRASTKGQLAIRGVAGLLLASVVLIAPAAEAHRTALRSPLVSRVGSASIQRVGPRTSLEILPSRGGMVRFRAAGATTTGGLPLSSSGNELRIQAVIEGLPQTISLPVDFAAGRARAVSASLGVPRLGLMEIVSVELLDPGAEVFASLGFAATGRLGSALAQVVGTPSPIQLSEHRDADVVLTPRHGGEILARMDSLRDRVTGERVEAAGNHLELELVVDGGAPIVRSVPFDIARGLFLAPATLGLPAGAAIEVRRLDFYDASDVRFATLGIRVLSAAP